MVVRHRELIAARLVPAERLGGVLAGLGAEAPPVRLAPAHLALVGVVIPDEEPCNHVAVQHAERTIPEIDSGRIDRPATSNGLELQARM